MSRRKFIAVLYSITWLNATVSMVVVIVRTFHAEHIDPELELHCANMIVLAAILDKARKGSKY